MILCLDVGNTNIFGGVFDGKEILLRFRYDTQHSSTSDQLGIFFRRVLKENGIDSKKIKKIAICSVVPELDYSLRSACKKYFNIEPFVLSSAVKTGLTIKTKNPSELGSDLIAGAIGASFHYPNKNIIVIDLGTATTFLAISSKKEILGASFLAGIRISMAALGNNAAKLFPVEILKPSKIVGKSTSESMQSGLYYGHLGAIKEIINGITQEAFGGKKPIVVGTGGLAYMFEAEDIFTKVLPDLVVSGLSIALQAED